MKTTFVAATAVLILLTINGKAQTTSNVTTRVGGTSFGIRAGVNFQNLNGKDANGDKSENKLKTGFHVGANAEIPVAPEFYIQPGVLFSTKGAKLQTTDAKFNLSYLEVPVNFLYKPVLGSGHLLLGFGPYAGYALGGKVNPVNGDKISITFQDRVTASEQLNGYYAKRFDAGANFLAGYELSNKISFQLNAQLGLVKVSPRYPDETMRKNTGFGISAGYRF